MAEANFIKATPGQLADFFYKCNKYQSFRDEFLSDPIAKLRGEDIIVGDAAAKLIVGKIQELKDEYYDEIATIPDWEEHGHELIYGEEGKLKGLGLLVKINSQGGAIP